MKKLLTKDIYQTNKFFPLQFTELLAKACDQIVDHGHNH
jgi:hypothetical protein